LRFYVKKEWKKVWSVKKKYAFFASAFRKGSSVQWEVEKGNREAGFVRFLPVKITLQSFLKKYLESLVKRFYLCRQVF